MTLDHDVRRAFLLPEILIAMVVIAIVGVSIVKLSIGQAQFFERQNAGHDARTVSRASLNMFLSELRMVEATSGVVSASASSLTLRIPYALGVVCGTSGSTTTLSLVPVDSAIYAETGFSGYAWRGSTGAYTYVESGTGLTSGATSLCTAASITTLTGGKVIGVTPALPTQATAGSAVLLFRRINYYFGPSTAIPGRVALWRKVVATNAVEELASPFDSTSRFRFYSLNASAATDAVPPVANIRGIQLALIGASEREPRGAASYQKSEATSAVFFRNRAQ